MGSDPSLATPEHGERLVDAATREVAEDYNRFLRDAA
jgi:creatinine amidohydrolase